MTQMDTQKNDRVRPQGRRTARTLILAALAVLVLGSFTTLRAFQNRDDGRDANGRDDERERYAIGLWGDLPYSDVQAQVGVPNLIADMNSQELAFTVHDGDLKAGNGTPGSVTPTTCADALYTQALGFFNSLRAPAIFTTGDNDWTDCDRASNGSFNSRERLDHERQLFFSTPFTLGQHRFRQEVQSTPLCLGLHRSHALRGKPPLEPGWSYLRLAQCPGLVQQPV